MGRGKMAGRLAFPRYAVRVFNIHAESVAALFRARCSCFSVPFNSFHVSPVFPLSGCPFNGEGAGRSFVLHSRLSRVARRPSSPVK